jgi:hypothetical protein
MAISKIKKIYIGFDPREAHAYAVSRKSLQEHVPYDVGYDALVLSDLVKRGLYWRPISKREGQMYDVISEAPMATEFAISRFLLQALAGDGWVMFVDGDVLARKDLTPLFCDIPDDKYAVMCVQHKHVPDNQRKMDNQTQTSYPRKNWSSMMLWNCDHPAHRRLTLGTVNTLPGRDLHAFRWLADHEIGSVPVEYNWLAGVSHGSLDLPAIVHFTNGVPGMSGQEEDVPFANEWHRSLSEWAHGVQNY